MISLKHLSNEDVLKNLSTLKNDEVNTVANILVHLIEANSRKLYAERGYSSMFAYCVEALNYCEGTAWRRTTAAKCIEQFPELLALFKCQKISLEAIALVNKILTPENKSQVIEAVCGKNKTAVECYIASNLPPKDIREAIKPLPSMFISKPKNDDSLTQPETISSDPIKTTSDFRAEVKDELNAELRLDTMEVEDEVNFEIRLKAKASAVEKLKRVQELRGTKESLGDLLELLLDVYLDKNAPEARIERREKRAQCKSKATTSKDDAIVEEETSPTVVTRNISRKIRDEVYMRDGGRCAFVAKDGKRCSCRKHLQIDHVKPFAIGGANETNNLRLLCPEHNRWAAEMTFGKEKMRYFHQVGKF